MLLKCIIYSNVCFTTKERRWTSEFLGLFFFFFVITTWLHPQESRGYKDGYSRKKILVYNTYSLKSVDWLGKWMELFLMLRTWTLFISILILYLEIRLTLYTLEALSFELEVFLSIITSKLNYFLDLLLWVPPHFGNSQKLCYNNSP